MINRRTLITGAGALALSGIGGAAYGFAIEPLWRLAVRHYKVAPEGWPLGLRLRLAVIADLHASEPQMPVDRIEEIVATTNGMAPDAILLLGDYAASHRWQTRRVLPFEWAAPLAKCKAPLGVHAVLGNHDWWDDLHVQSKRKGPTASQIALEHVGIPVYENKAVRLVKDGRPFWLTGVGDQLAFFAGYRNGRGHFRGTDDLDGTLAQVTDNAPIVLMAHEPDIFTRVPSRVSLTISGHTHGGQVRLMGYSPIVPSRYGNRYAYGHIVEDGRHLVVSGGLGCSQLPVRIGVPPEIVIIDLGPSEPIAA